MSARIRYIGGGQFVYRGQNIGPDYGFPPVACELGWSLRRVQLRAGEIVALARAPKQGAGCDHSGTDGTIPCPDCGILAAVFIEAATAYLYDRADDDRSDGT